MSMPKLARAEVLPSTAEMYSGLALYFDDGRTACIDHGNEGHAWKSGVVGLGPDFSDQPAVPWTWPTGYDGPTRPAKNATNDPQVAWTVAYFMSDGDQPAGPYPIAEPPYPPFPIPIYRYVDGQIAQANIGVAPTVPYAEWHGRLNAIRVARGLPPRPLG